MSEATDASKPKDEENKEVVVAVPHPPQLAVVDKKHPLEHSWSFWCESFACFFFFFFFFLVCFGVAFFSCSHCGCRYDQRGGGKSAPPGSQGRRGKLIFSSLSLSLSLSFCQSDKKKKKKKEKEKRSSLRTTFALLETLQRWRIFGVISTTCASLLDSNPTVENLTFEVFVCLSKTFFLVPIRQLSRVQEWH